MIDTSHITNMILIILVPSKAEAKTVAIYGNYYFQNLNDYWESVKMTMYRIKYPHKICISADLLENSIDNTHQEKVVVFEVKNELGSLGFYWVNKVLYFGNCNFYIRKCFHGYKK